MTCNPWLHYIFHKKRIVDKIFYILLFFITLDISVKIVAFYDTCWNKSFVLCVEMVCGVGCVCIDCTAWCWQRREVLRAIHYGRCGHWYLQWSKDTCWGRRCTITSPQTIQTIEGSWSKDHDMHTQSCSQIPTLVGPEIRLSDQYCVTLFLPKMLTFPHHLYIQVARLLWERYRIIVDCHSRLRDVCSVESERERGFVCVPVV